MVTENSMELENQAFLSNQDITGEAPKLLLCSSIASGSDLMVYEAEQLSCH